MSPFQPVGEVARWRVVYELLRPLSVGDVLSYEQMAHALGLDASEDRHVIQMAMRRAARQFEEVDKHAVDSVKNVGYRVVQAVEHLHLAERHQRRAGKQLRSGHSKAVNVDLNLVDAETRKAFEAVGRAFAMQLDFNRRMDVRQRRLEDAVSQVSERSDRTDEELAELRARLARLEDSA